MLKSAKSNASRVTVQKGSVVEVAQSIGPESRQRTQQPLRACC